ncbi:hypothetical protein BGZ65_011367 [Modicella reniformis]|uniref:Fe2OG dioxygenase domain-containing protein n=1 Tax=Modicella reniformis TaxID=1440133 RepID=A0A9P6SP45_9FUNG|nr:hypothetical protein BGZ65_011367 [Modicella reniformis]
MTLTNTTESHKYADVPRIDISPLYGSDPEAKAKWELAIRAYNKDNQKQIRNGYYLSIKDKKAVESFCFLNPNFNPEHQVIKDNLPLHEVNVWPKEEKYPGFRQYQESFYSEAFNLSKYLLRGCALALGKNEQFFDEYMDEKTTLSSVVLIRYPFLDPYPPAAIKTAEDGTMLSFEWHEDVSLLTVLYQSQVQNLQVELPGQGFVDIKPDDECFLVNAGTYMSHITDNYFFAPIHRVTWINEERQSLPFFLNLGYKDTIEPFSPNNPEKKSVNKAISYGDYLQGGLKGLINKNGQT